LGDMKGVNIEDCITYVHKLKVDSGAAQL
jgi:hypothetical protein